MDNRELLRQEAFRGLEEKGLSSNQEYIDRLQYELEVVERLCFIPYFLIMWDIARFARENGIIYGPGRGSGTASLLNYCLKITLVDPIRYGLFFERFLNPNRVSPPDIDWDTAERERVIEYLQEKYGSDRVARVGSINFLRTKSAIKDIGRVLGKELSEVEKIAELVPPPVAGLWKSFEAEAEVEPKLLSPKYSDIIEPVKKLWGVCRSYGTHAGGVAIAPGKINEFIPLYKDKEGNPVSQFDWRDLEAAGLLKFDILGLSTLEVIGRCLSYMERDGFEIDVNELEDGDKEAYDIICAGDLDGIFQLGGSESIKQMTLSFAPRSIEDLSLVTSLFRPGPLAAKIETKYGKKSMVEIALGVRNKSMEPEYIHESVIPILESTHSVPVFQEQLMKICTDLCNYSPSESDYMRKILGKKLQDKMVEQKPKFVSGAVSNGVQEEKADALFESFKVYSQYLFAKAHAVAYSRITYITAYLKAHYPVHFYAALLSCEKNPDNIILFAGVIRESGISILPPDINLSDVYHAPEPGQVKAIRYGLSHIKGMSLSAAKEIIRVRNEN